MDESRAEEVDNQPIRITDAQVSDEKGTRTRALAQLVTRSLVHGRLMYLTYACESNRVGVVEERRRGASRGGEVDEGDQGGQRIDVCACTKGIRRRGGGTEEENEACIHCHFYFFC